MYIKNVFCQGTYRDTLGQEWPYWALSEPGQMWLDVDCNQASCVHPAIFVGTTDIFGDGVHYFDGAEAWCYFCMPKELMTPEAARLVHQAEWARQVGVEKFIDVVDDLVVYRGDEIALRDFIDNELMAATVRLRHQEEDHMASSLLPSEQRFGRVQKPKVRYAIRPDCDIPNPEIALNLNCTSSEKK